MFLAVERFGTIHDLAAGTAWSAGQLASEIERRAETLRPVGIGPGSLVAITHGGTAAFFADLFAAWSLGSAAACLDPTLTPSERENVVSFCKPGAVLSESGVARGPGTPASNTSATLDDAALVLFTSGTTGAPKGVVLSFRALLARLNLNRDEIGDEVLARTLVTLPTHFGHGLIGNALTPLVAGGDIFLVPRGLALAQQLGPMADEHAITFMSSVPSLWQMALRMSVPPKKSTLRRVHVGSAPLSAAAWSRIAAWCGCPVVNCYGITETANWIAGASTSTRPPTDGFVGKPWGGSAGVVDSAGMLHAAGTGEIVIKSPALMTGYLNRPDLTAAVLNDGWYRTGDLGRRDADGYFWVHDRKKNLIISGGENISPAEVERVLLEHPDVRECGVIGRPDPRWDEVPVAYVIRRAGALIELLVPGLGFQPPFGNLHAHLPDGALHGAGRFHGLFLARGFHP